MLKNINASSKKLIAVLLTLIILGGAGVGGYRYYQSTREQPPTEEVPEEPVVESGWKLYTNSEYGFSVEVPVGWTQHKEGEYSSKGSWLVIRVRENNERLGVIEWLKETEAQYPNLYDMVVGGIPPEPNALVAGQPAVFLHDFGGLSLMAPTKFLVAFTRDVYEFEVRIVNPEKEDALEVFQHALETFRLEGESEVKLPEFPDLEYGVAVP